MSYASVASHNIPFGEMPQPDQNLADGHFAGEHTAEGGVDHKINILPAGSDPEHPNVHAPASVELAEPLAVIPPPTYEPSTSGAAPTPAPAPHKADVHMPESGAQFEAEAKQAKKDVEKGAKNLKNNAEKEAKDLKQDAEKKGKELKKKAKAELNEAENKLGPYWEKTKDVVLRPGTLGGLVGVLNVGILSTLGYYAYTRREQPWDRRIVGGAAAGTLALFGAEGYLAESYLSTPEGRQEAERAKREGSKAYLQAKEIILRPGVAGGLAGFFNLAVIGTVGFFSYKHWNQPWDRRTVSAVTIGLLGLSGLEGYAGKVYADKELPKH